MFCACDSFLDKQPSATSDAPITEVSQLLSLYDYVTTRMNTIIRRCMPPMFTVCPWHCTMLVTITFGADQMSLYALSSEVMETTTGQYTLGIRIRKIFNAITIIASVGSVNGSQEDKRRGVVQCLVCARWFVFRCYRPCCHTVRQPHEMGCRCVLGTLFTRISRVLRWEELCPDS